MNTAALLLNMNTGSAASSPDGQSPMTFEEARVFYDRLDPLKKLPAIAALRAEFNDNVKEDVRFAIAQQGRSWCAGSHFSFGMSVRNTLRRKGFGEDYWPIWNLDDIYVYLVEDAVK